MSSKQEFKSALEEIQKGGAPKYHESSAKKNKLFVRKRLERLLDEGSFQEEAEWANYLAGNLPADAVVTGLGKIHGKPVAIMANDSTVKAGSWGYRTVEKIIRIQERAKDLKIPLLYLVDSAGARITDQVEMFPGRRGAGKIFYNQVELSGFIPQICLLFGPSAAGGAYIPAFCDIVVMVKKNASMYLGSPRMAKMVIGEDVSLEEMGGARMHTSESGCADVLAKNEEEAIDYVKDYIRYFPSNCHEKTETVESKAPAFDLAERYDQIVPKDQYSLFNIKEVIDGLIDEGSFVEVKKKFAGELVTGFARIEGKPVGILANQPKVKGGVLFADSADKGARFIWLCDAFNIPLIFMADVPGFMIGTKVEKGGIIRHGAKMISALSGCSVPRICVVIRKAYGAGLYAMSGPGFDPDATFVMPGAQIAVMGPQAAVNAVFAGKIEAIEDEEERQAYIEEKRKEYSKDIDLFKLGSELVYEKVVFPENLRAQISTRLDFCKNKERMKLVKKHGVYPV